MPNGSDLHARATEQTEQMIDAWFGALEQWLASCRSMTKMIWQQLPYSAATEAMQLLQRDGREQQSTLGQGRDRGTGA